MLGYLLALTLDGVLALLRFGFPSLSSEDSDLSVGIRQGVPEKQNQ